MFSANSVISPESIPMLIGISAGIGIVILIIVLVSKFLRKDSTLNSIEVALKNKNFNKALSLSLKQIKESPGNFMGNYYLAQAYEGVNQINKAVNYYEQASIIAKNAGQEELKPQIFMKIASLFKKLKRSKDALGYYMLVLDKIPNHTKALFEVSEVLMDLRNFHKAKKYLEHLVRLKEDHTRARYILARIYRQLNDNSSCASQLEEVIKRVPRNDIVFSKASLMLADAYESLKKYNSAIETLKPLLDNKELMEDVYVRTIAVYLKSKNIQKAQDLVNQLNNKVSKGKKVEANYLLGNAYFNSGQIYKGLKLLKEAHNIDPKFMDLHEIINNYRVLFQNPAFENYFTPDNNLFNNLILSAFHIKFATNTTRNESFWIVKTKDKIHVAYKLPKPLSSADMDAIAHQLRSEALADGSVCLYTLFDTTPECKSHFLFRKFEIISREKLIQLIQHRGA